MERSSNSLSCNIPVGPIPAALLAASCGLHGRREPCHTRWDIVQWTIRDAARVVFTPAAYYDESSNRVATEQLAGLAAPALHSTRTTGKGTSPCTVLPSTVVPENYDETLLEDVVARRVRCVAFCGFSATFLPGGR